MKARVFRLFRNGAAVDSERLRESGGPCGELRLRIRLGGRDALRDIHVASLEDDAGGYLVPCLDHARVVEIRGQWLCLAGEEVLPINRGRKRIRANRFPQTWWCRVTE